MDAADLNSGLHAYKTFSLLSRLLRPMVLLALVIDIASCWMQPQFHLHCFICICLRGSMLQPWVSECPSHSLKAYGSLLQPHRQKPGLCHLLALFSSRNESSACIGSCTLLLVPFGDHWSSLLLPKQQNLERRMAEGSSHRLECQRVLCLSLIYELRDFGCMNLPSESVLKSCLKD